MRNKGKIYKFLNDRPSTYTCIGLLVFAFAFPPCPLARADEDPFQMDSGRWMSFGHYKDADKRGILDARQPTPPPPPQPEVVPPPPVAPIVAAPSRPIDLPIMPGLNKEFSVKVDTTDDDLQTSNSPVLGTNAPPDIHPSDKNWQTPSSTPKMHTPGDDKDPSLGVRMTFLPNDKISPVPNPDRMSAQRRGQLALEKSLKEKKAAKAADDAAITAAINAYKKQQLDAIQSDRQTMQALQDAISSLGLQKKLGFMTNGALTNTPDAPPPASIDVPALENGK